MRKVMTTKFTLFVHTMTFILGIVIFSRYWDLTYQSSAADVVILLMFATGIDLTVGYTPTNWFTKHNHYYKLLKKL